MDFSPNKVKTFYFEDYSFDPKRLEAVLRYSFDSEFHFEERYHFKGAKVPADIESRKVFDLALRHLHLMAGVSYYKAALPPEIKFRNYTVPPETARLFEQLYFHGLGEFAYRNAIDLQGRIKFPSNSDISYSASALKLPHRSLVPVGGGKDSAVTVEILRGLDQELSLFVMGSNTKILEVAGIPGLPVINVPRTLSPLLLELNKQGAYNGHVPISAILSFLLVAAGVLYGFDSVVMSYEHSANSPTLIYNGQPVNHQYSKSFECEKLLHDYIKKNLLSGLNYFSFIRPLSEVQITALFSRLTRYHPRFTSCNRNFTVSGDKSLKMWCSDCPKCRFVFLLLAVFLPKEELLKIFGSNLLTERSQLEGYEELIGLKNHKPFECVGEIDESRWALKQLSEREEWKDDLIVAELSGKIEAASRTYGNFFSNENLLPSNLAEGLKKRLEHAGI